MNRRGFLFGGATLLAAPSIVRVSSLMPVSTRTLTFEEAMGLLRKIIDENLYMSQFHRSNLGLLASFAAPPKLFIKPTMLIVGAPATYCIEDNVPSLAHG